MRFKTINAYKLSTKANHHISKSEMLRVLKKLRLHANGVGSYVKSHLAGDTTNKVKHVVDRDCRLVYDTPRAITRTSKWLRVTKAKIFDNFITSDLFTRHVFIYLGPTRTKTYFSSHLKIGLFKRLEYSINSKY